MQQPGLRQVFENEFLTVSLLRRAKADESGSEQSSDEESEEENTRVLEFGQSDQRGDLEKAETVNHLEERKRNVEKQLQQAEMSQ